MSKSGQTSGGPATAAKEAWKDNGALSSGGKFKFVHLIAAAAVCLFLGYFLAKGASTTAPSQIVAEADAMAEQVT